jgi:hypothetical protein
VFDEMAPSASIVVLDTSTGDERWRVDREFQLHSRSEVRETGPG